MQKYIEFETQLQTTTYTYCANEFTLKMDDEQFIWGLRKAKTNGRKELDTGKVNVVFSLR